MKRIVLMALLALALPLAAFAGSTVDFTNSGGTLTGSNAGLSLTGSEVIKVEGLGTGALGNDATLSFSTGSYIGTVGAVSTFNAGGSFTIIGNGINGVPSGSIFVGSFTTPVTLTGEGSVSGGTQYVVFAHISGTWYTGQTAVGITNESWVGSFTTGEDGFMGSSTFGSGDTFLTPTPEPGTLGLLGTGLVGLAGAIRKKFKA